MLHDILMVVAGLVPGLIIGFFIAKVIIEKQLKKNPPINEQMIKVMMSQMGRTPSQKQVNQIMKSMNSMK